MAPILTLVTGILVAWFAPQIARKRVATFGRVWSRELAAEQFSVLLFRLVGAAFIVASSVQLWRNLHN
jgi:hypothetical protein